MIEPRCDCKDDRSRGAGLGITVSSDDVVDDGNRLGTAAACEEDGGLVEWALEFDTGLATAALGVRR